MFAGKGFYNARVSEIARRAGVADGTIYLYFKSKDEILISIFEEEMEKFIGRVREQVAEAGTPVERLEAFIQAHLALVREYPKLAQVFQVELRQSNRFIKEYTGTRLKEYLDIIGSIIEEGQRDGVLRADLQPGLLKRALFGALDEIATHWVLSKNGRYDLQQSAGALTSIFLNGVAVRSRDPNDEGRKRA